MEPVLIIALAGLCTALPFWLGQRHGIVRLVSPMHLLSYFCLFGFLLKVSIYSVRPELSFYGAYVETSWADLRGALYLGVFILLICLGYRAACQSFCRADSVAAARIVASGLEKRGLLFGAAFAVAAATFWLILRTRGASGFDRELLAGLNTAKQINVNADGVGATLAGIKTFFIVPKFAFVLLLANGIVSGRRIVLWLAMLLGGLLMLIAVVSGDRFELVELLIYALATHLMLGGHMSLRVGLVGFGVVAVLALISAHMTALRLGLEGGSVWTAVGAQIVGSTYFLDINAAVMVTDRVTRPMMLWGESYTWWSFGWVPRAVWPEKPAIDLGVMFKRDIMGVFTGGAFNVTGPGEAFINFRWAGLLVGFALGWVYRCGEAWLLTSTNCMRHGAFLLYPILFYPFVQATLQSSFSAFIVGAVAQSVLIWAMIMVFLPRYTLWVRPHGPYRSHLYVS